MKTIITILFIALNLFAISAGELDYNKKIALQYCKNLAYIGASTENVTPNQYFDACLRSYPNTFSQSQAPSMAKIRNVLKDN